MFFKLLKDSDESLWDECTNITILFDNFNHIYLVFCSCFIYKIPW
jgi:hypothetical protein